MWSRVLILWLALGIGAVATGGAALYLGQFIQSNIREELSVQQISFNAAEKLSDEEKAIPGLLENAGQPVTTGNQAKIYSELIALHVSEAAKTAGYEGETYATVGGIQRGLRAEVAAATEAKDDAALEKAQAELDKVTNLRNTMLTASTLRGNLLSAFGWDNFGTGATVTGAIIAVLGLVFFGLYIYELRRGHLPATA
jgi:hypothetical protein